jgi:hypothetical protein
MKKSSSLLAALLVPAFAIALASAAPALAQDSKPAASAPKTGTVTIKEIDKNDKFRVYEAISHPGDMSPSALRSARVVHAIKGGTLERTFADGKKETVQWKTGDTKIISETQPYSVKNVGKTTVHLLVVESK